MKPQAILAEETSVNSSASLAQPRPDRRSDQFSLCSRHANCSNNVADLAVLSVPLPVNTGQNNRLTERNLRQMVHISLNDTGIRG